MQKKVEITTPFITLGQLLKLTDTVDSGGMVKAFLREQNVIVNENEEKRRGRKLYPNDVVQINGKMYVIVSKDK
ncbi:MAG TPA: S4 domain-containing protein YaaA [Bacillota bacterium]